MRVACTWPQVHRSNTSTLACLIRDSYADKLVLPSMDGTLPLQILVEIGVEKLSADYCNVLIGELVGCWAGGRTRRYIEWRSKEIAEVVNLRFTVSLG